MSSLSAIVVRCSRAVHNEPALGYGHPRETRPQSNDYGHAVEGRITIAHHRSPSPKGDPARRQCRGAAPAARPPAPPSMGPASVSLPHA